LSSGTDPEMRAAGAHAGFVLAAYDADDRDLSLVVGAGVPLRAQRDDLLVRPGADVPAGAAEPRVVRRGDELDHGTTALDVDARVHLAPMPPAWMPVQHVQRVRRGVARRHVGDAEERFPGTGSPRRFRLHAERADDEVSGRPRSPAVPPVNRNP